MERDAEGESEALRRRADALRDAGSWLEAAAAYADFLRLNPQDAGMREQQAHCLKEAGRLQEALALYRQVAAAWPEAAGPARQIGQVALLLDQPALALEAFSRAVAADPADPGGWESWRALYTARAPRGAPAGGMLLELSDLSNWIRGGKRAPSGMQRVQLDLVRGALRQRPAPSLCAMPMAGGGWRELPAALFHRLDHLMASGSDAEAPEWRQAAELLERLLTTRPPLAFAPGAVLITLGGTWGMPHYLSCLRQARARDGLRHVAMLYDCVPLVVPEHCREGVVHGYARWFANLALHADAVLTISRATRDDLRRLHAALLPELPVPPAAVIRLDGQPQILVGHPAQPPQHPLLRAGAQPFVPFVSTIEGRKNHLMVFQVWLRLLRRLGPARTPLLLCIGRPGWRSEAALALLEQLPELRAKVRLLDGIPDTLLAEFYRRSLFTLYNSHHEGWGLPVTESLAAGKVVLTPRHSSLIEAGQGGALFFPPDDAPALLEQLERLITDPGYRAAAEAAITAVPRSWEAIAVQAMAEARRLLAPERPLPVLSLANGRLHELRRIDAMKPELAMAVAETVREGEGWHPLGDGPAWTRPGAAMLSLPLGQAQQGPLWLALELRAGPAPQRLEVRALREGAPPVGPWVLDLAAGEAASLRLAIPEGGAQLRVELLTQEAAELDGEAVGVGVVGFALGREAVLAERLELLERRLLQLAVAV